MNDSKYLLHLLTSLHAYLLHRCSPRFASGARGSASAVGESWNISSVLYLAQLLPLAVTPSSLRALTSTGLSAQHSTRCAATTVRYLAREGPSTPCAWEPEVSAGQLTTLAGSPRSRGLRESALFPEEFGSEVSFLPTTHLEERCYRLRMHLRELLGDAQRRQQVIQDCVKVIEDEVKEKSGLAGMAVKGGFSVIQGIKPGFVRESVDHLLDDFATKLDPLYQEAKSGGKAVLEHFESNTSRIADALLQVTDEKARRAKSAMVVKTYERMRDSAKKHVEAAVPRLAKLVAKYDPPGEAKP